MYEVVESTSVAVIIEDIRGIIEMMVIFYNTGVV